MTLEKFESEINTLNKFFTIYCHDKHQNQYEKEYIIPYSEKTFYLKANLCSECHSLLHYAILKLQDCPNDPKPRCRNCPNPCYEKDKYKQMAKMMRYSGMKLGLTKAAKRLKKLFKKS
ncbi:nitrous oxide-stimulated promoter family protein [Caminibacter sp.]